MNRINMVIDGNTAAAYIAYAFTEIAPIYPITPSTPMAELIDEWASRGKLNLFGNKVKVVQMQSEAGVAGTLHGTLASGMLASTFTSSQGLLLMVPNMFKIAGELLPAVFYVAARTIATHALSIFGDHSDVYSCRQTGCAILAEGNVQEIIDLSPISHLSAIKGSIPFINFFDGFNTSHEMQKVEIWSENDLQKLIDLEAIKMFRKRAINPNNPKARGTAQNSDTFFQNREACNTYYNAIPKIVEDYMQIINKQLNTNYSLFNYYGSEEATNVIVAMGSICNTIEEVIDYLNKKEKKYGLIKVRLFRPFSVHHFINVLPSTMKKITILDRTKEPGAVAEPLFLDVAAALQETKFANVSMFGGRYGLSSKDTRPDQIISVFENAENGCKKFFTIGIIDDITKKSLSNSQKKFQPSSKALNCKFWGFGSDGTVGACKNIAKIIGENTNNFVRASFSYDSKKSGGTTISYIRIDDNQIKAGYTIKEADFVACHKLSYLNKYRIVEELKPNGIFLLNCNLQTYSDDIPVNVKKYIAQNNIRFFAINADEIATKIGLENKPSIVLQASFFKLMNIFSEQKAKELMRFAVQKQFSKKDKAVITMNYVAIEAGMLELEEIKVPKDWKSLRLAEEKKDDSNYDYIEKIVKPVLKLEGDNIPVSAFLPFADGVVPTGMSKYEKLNTAHKVPYWNSKNCISCNFCSFVCPHAAIRPIVLDLDEEKLAPEGIKLIPLSGTLYKFGITVSVFDCKGCNSCVNACPGKNGNKALEMRPIAECIDTQKYFEYCINMKNQANLLNKFPATNVRGSQFKTPLLEFSGACAGCGETPYAKLVTQLFGERLVIANATGCSSIWGASSPAVPYTKNGRGKGPAWANSLFEDNAEFGFGIWLAQNEMRESLISKLKSMIETDKFVESEIVEFIKTKNDAEKNNIAADALVKAIEKNCINRNCEYILENKDFLYKKSVWLFGGDGWAYDIGFGGLDHVMSLGANINALVFDTEVYSNTGGQASKATPLGAAVKFAVAGKQSKKKNLAEMMINYGYVYVAQIALGADYNQTLKALIEAESYDGPSLIVAYAPCISHGIKSGMGMAQQEAKLAVSAGYWNLFRFDPRKRIENQNPFMLDSKAPSLPVEAFLSNELRYSLALKKEDIIQRLQNDVDERYKYLKKMSEKII